MSLVQTGIKSTQCPRLNILLDLYCSVACFSARDPERSDAWHHGFYQIPTDKKCKPASASVRNLPFHQYNNPKQKSK